MRIERRGTLRESRFLYQYGYTTWKNIYVCIPVMARAIYYLYIYIYVTAYIVYVTHRLSDIYSSGVVYIAHQLKRGPYSIFFH